MRDQDFSFKIDHIQDQKLLSLKRVAVDMSNKTHRKDWNTRNNEHDLPRDDERAHNEKRRTRSKQKTTYMIARDTTYVTTLRNYMRDCWCCDQKLIITDLKNPLNSF